MPKPEPTPSKSSQRENIDLRVSPTADDGLLKYFPRITTEEYQDQVRRDREYRNAIAIENQELLERKKLYAAVAKRKGATERKRLQRQREREVQIEAGIRFPDGSMKVSFQVNPMWSCQAINLNKYCVENPANNEITT
jgi:hypothetical protein